MSGGQVGVLQQFETNEEDGRVRKKMCVCDAGCVSVRSGAGGGSFAVMTSSWGDFRRG